MNEARDLCCFGFDEHGNACDSFDYEPAELEKRALALRRELGEVTTVTINPSPFIISQ